MSKQIFTIMKLKNEDYLNLHKQFSNIKKEDLENSLGFADREAGEIFIRKSGNEKVDNEVILHEAEELFKETSPHEKNGIRFGWFKKAFGFSSQPAVNVVAPILASLLLGPAGFALAGLAGAGTSALTQKLNTGKINPLQVGLSGLGGALAGGAMAPGVAASKAVGGGYLGQVASGLQSAVGIQSGAQKTLAAKALPSITSAAPSTISAGLPQNALGQLGNVGSQFAPAGNLSIGGVAPTAGAAASNIGAGINMAALGSKAVTPSIPLYGGQAPAGTSPLAPAPISSVSPIGPASAGLPGTLPPATAPASKTLIEQAKGLVNVPNVLGAASIAGSMGGKQPEFQMPSTVEDIRKKLLEQTQVDPITGEMKQGGLTEVGKQAQLELGNILKSTPQELYAPNKDAYYQAVLRRTRTSYDEAKKNLDAAYNVAGVYGSGEHLAAQDKLAQQLTNAESDLFAQTEQRNFEFAQNQKYNAIKDAMQVDKDVFDDIIGITGIEASVAAQIYGAKVADIISIREALGTLGTELILRGTTGAGKQPMINIGMGR